jgi:phosphopantothenoylcysteine decarboxylase/phosphopantothenate--cysteine ligase
MNFLITAGPTREPLDPVRYLSNRSSGRMGYALAEAALAQGHAVTLISGPVGLKAPEGARVVNVEAAQQMWEAARASIEQEQPDIAILSAAVADYRPARVEAQKIKKQADSLTLELERTPDILGAMRAVFGFRGTLVGFAAETENLVPNAQSKLHRKGCDMIVANDVSRTDIGFDGADNEVILCYSDGRAEHVPKMTKQALAVILIEKCIALRPS